MQGQSIAGMQKVGLLDSGLIGNPPPHADGLPIIRFLPSVATDGRSPNWVERPLCFDRVACPGFCGQWFAEPDPSRKDRAFHEKMSAEPELCSRIS